MRKFPLSLPETTGTWPCQNVNLDDNLVMPLEEDAINDGKCRMTKRISYLLSVVSSERVSRRPQDKSLGIEYSHAL
jgi:hypothetical protein